MRVGTKSLLWGVHQVLLHPIFVTRAWIALYREWPSWKELVCIVVHDWGYLGCRSMDGPDGECHPWLGAKIACALFGTPYLWLCLLHSRHTAEALGMVPSRLCWADKLMHAFMPVRLYLLLGRLSGEVAEYRQQCIDLGLVPAGASYEEWYGWTREHLIRQAVRQRAEMEQMVSRLVKP